MKHSIDWDGFVRGKVSVPTLLIGDFCSQNTINNKSEKSVESSGLGKEKENHLSNKNKTAKREWVFFIVTTVVTILVGLLAAYMPIKKNNEILEKEQATQIFPFVTPLDIPCDSPDANVEYWKSSEGPLEFNGNSWQVCIKNNSNRPVYKFEASAELTEEDGRQYGENYLGVEMPLNTSEPINISIFYPGTTSKVLQSGVQVESTWVHEGSRETSSSFTSNSRIELSYKFTDSNGVEWESIVEILNLNDLSKLEYNVLVPISKI